MIRNMICVVFVCTAVFSGQSTNAGGVRGNMYNLPEGNELSPIARDETIHIRVTRFNAAEALRLLDENGKQLPLTPNFGDLRVSFTGSRFAFSLPLSGTTNGRQAVTIQFFRPENPGSIALETQRLEAVIISDGKKAFQDIDVSVPIPSQMTDHSEPQLVIVEDCINCCKPRRGILRCLFGR